MNDRSNNPNAFGTPPEKGNERRSPVRPPMPESPPTTRPMPKMPGAPKDERDYTNPVSALNQLRKKMEIIANEFAEGKVNRAQFNAVYGRYGEQRAIIERLLERNPDSSAWKQVVGTGGHTSFLRQHFEGHPLYFVVFRHKVPRPLMIGGKGTPNVKQLAPVLKALWSMPRMPEEGLARKQMGESEWLVMAVGRLSLTMVVFMMEPSRIQSNLVRDLHADYERANRAALERGTSRLERMVFPQRALVEGGL